MKLLTLRVSCQKAGEVAWTTRISSSGADAFTSLAYDREEEADHYSYRRGGRLVAAGNFAGVKAMVGNGVYLNYSNAQWTGEGNTTARASKEIENHGKVHAEKAYDTPPPTPITPGVDGALVSLDPATGGLDWAIGVGAPPLLQLSGTPGVDGSATQTGAGDFRIKSMVVTSGVADDEWGGRQHILVAATWASNELWTRRFDPRFYTAI